jgi:hypothetical protein
MARARSALAVSNIVRNFNRRQLQTHLQRTSTFSTLQLPLRSLGPFIPRAFQQKSVTVMHHVQSKLVRWPAEGTCVASGQTERSGRFLSASGRITQLSMGRVENNDDIDGHVTCQLGRILRNAGATPGSCSSFKSVNGQPIDGTGVWRWQMAASLTSPSYDEDNLNRDSCPSQACSR